MIATGTFIVIAGDKNHTKFMQACDVFEKHKVLGKQYEYKADYVGTPTNLNIENSIKVFREALETTGYIVALIHFKHYTIGKEKFINDGSIKPYINKTIQTISDGKKFALFTDLLKDLNIEHTTDGHFFVK